MQISYPINGWVFSGYLEKKRYEQIKIETIPNGAYISIDNGEPFVTPKSFGLEIKDYVIKVERFRYLTEEIKISREQLLENDVITIPLKPNKAFVNDYYLVAYTRCQADGISKEVQKYIYDDNARIIRIDDYTPHELTGYYTVTLDEKGRLLKMQYNSIDGIPTLLVKEQKYDENGLPLSNSFNNDERFIEIEYGTDDSEYKRIVTVKYFYDNTPEEEKKKRLEDGHLPHEIYWYK